MTEQDKVNLLISMARDDIYTEEAQSAFRSGAYAINDEIGAKTKTPGACSFCEKKEYMEPCNLRDMVACKEGLYLTQGNVLRLDCLGGFIEFEIEHCPRCGSRLRHEEEVN